jgi:hypothetical protein
MKINEIVTSNDQTSAVFSFARMNPPTIGHQKLIDRILSEASAMNCPYYIMVSQTVDSVKNPLPYNIKMEFIKKLFPSVNFMESVTIEKNGEHKTVKTPFEMLEYLCQNGIKNVVMVVGEDRVESFENMIKPYIGKEFDLNSFKVISAGTRNGDGIDEKASGTLIRQMVKMDMKDQFDKFIPTNDQTIKDDLFNTLAKYL